MGTFLFTTHHPTLVVLSIVIAAVASYAALDIGSRVTLARGIARGIWLTGGAVAMGIGIWSMHFTGMLAFHLPTPITYHIPLVAVSVAIAVAASFLALFVISRAQITRTMLILSGILMGGAIAGMHYMGMAAMRVHAHVRYIPSLVVLSILIAISASVVALRLAIHYRDIITNRAFIGKVGSALLMGFAIAGMHYTGMAAARFLPDSTAIAPSNELVVATSGLAGVVVAATLVILGFALLAIMLDRWRVAAVAETEALRASEARLRRFHDALGFGVLVLDGQGVVKHANQPAADVLGLSLEELEGRPVHNPQWRYVHTDEAVTSPSELPSEVARQTGKAVRGALLGLDIQGRSLHWLLADAVPYLNAETGSVDEVVVSFMDVTKRKEAEDEQRRLHAREQTARHEAELASKRLAFLAEASETLGSSLNYERTLVRVAELTVPEMADWCAVDVLTPQGELERLAVTHRDPQKVRLALELQQRYPLNSETSMVHQVLRTGKPVLYPNIPLELLKASAQDEEHFELLQKVGLRSAVIVPLTSRGQMLGVLTLVCAESGQQFNEEDMRLAEELARLAGMAIDNARLYKEATGLNNELERRVDQRTAQLQEAYRELETFSYSVSHDLRAPLRGINGFSQALEEDYGDLLDDTARNYLRRIQVGASRMGELIDGLLNLSRLSRKPFERSEVNLSRIAQDVLSLLREEYPERMVAVQIEENVRVQGDRRLLAVVLGNLLENAWKFTQHQEHACIDFGLKERHPEVFYVRDNGAGFDMAYANKLFVPFQRLHDQGEFEGNGIGLATVQRIIHRHGGRIWAEGEEGKGATFYFTLSTDPGGALDA